MAAYFAIDNVVKLGHLDAPLLHGVAVAERYGVVFEGLAVDGDAVGRADGILTAVSLADGVLLVVGDVHGELEGVDNLMCLLGHTVFLDEREDGELDGCEDGGELEHDAAIATFELLLGVGTGHDGEEHTVYADGCLDDVWHVALVGLGVEILDLLAAVFGAG